MLDSGLQVEEDGPDVRVVVLSGEHDIATGTPLREAIDAAFADGRRVLVDLTPTTFIDSTILGVLLSGRGRADEHASGFGVLLGPGAAPTVQRIVDVTGIGPMLPLHGDRAAALAALRA